MANLFPNDLKYIFGLFVLQSINANIVHTSADNIRPAKVKVRIYNKSTECVFNKSVLTFNA